MYYYEHRSQHPTLFDEDGYLSFVQKDAMAEKLVDKVQWSRINKSNENIPFNFVTALSDFYAAADGDLSCQPLSSDAEFAENMFLIQFI